MMLLPPLHTLLQSLFIKLARDQGPEEAEKIDVPSRERRCPLRKLLPQESASRRRLPRSN